MGTTYLHAGRSQPQFPSNVNGDAGTMVDRA
jgi:hypothetical protein